MFARMDICWSDRRAECADRAVFGAVTCPRASVSVTWRLEKVNARVWLLIRRCIYYAINFPLILASNFEFDHYRHRPREPPRLALNIID